MLDYGFVHKQNSKQEIKKMVNPPHHIDESKWLDYINSNASFFWYINSPLGQLHKKEGLDPKLYYSRVYFDYNEKKGYSDTVVDFYTHCGYFQFPRLTLKRLDMMWALCQALDCHLIKNVTIVTEKRYLQLREKLQNRGKKSSSE